MRHATQPFEDFNSNLENKNKTVIKDDIEELEDEREKFSNKQENKKQTCINKDDTNSNFGNV